MNDNQITAIIIALINARYIVPGKDNEKTAKEIVDVYKILKDKTGSCDEESPQGEGQYSQFSQNQFGPGM